MNIIVQIILAVGGLIFLAFCGVSIFITAYGYYKDITEVQWYKDEYRRLKNLYEHERS